MRRKCMVACLVLTIAAALCTAGCGAAQSDSDPESESVSVSAESEAEPEDTADNSVSETALEDGVYEAEFSTDSSMFHINEACDGKGTLTVEGGVMTIHISLVSKNIANLYYGTAEEALEDEAGWIQPTEDEVTYSDGYTETVYGFDIPVPALDEEYSVAIIGTKGTWYDHMVSVSDPVAVEGENGAAESGGSETADDDTAGNEAGATGEEVAAEKISVDSLGIEDGTYTIEVTLEGGTGRADIESPAMITIADGAATAQITWSSSNYDYMIVGEEQYLPVSTEDGSVFEIPVDAFDYAMEVTADTTAMSEPHEIEHTIYFDSATIAAEEG